MIAFAKRKWKAKINLDKYIYIFFLNIRYVDIIYDSTHKIIWFENRLKILNKLFIVPFF